MRWPAARSDDRDRVLGQAAPLLAYEAGNHLHSYGGRVFRDGRYELRDDDDPQWAAFEPFTPEQVEQIETAIDAREVPGQITGERLPDGASATFALQRRTVRSDECPKAAPAARGDPGQYRRAAQAPPVPSTWRLWTNGTA